MMKNIAMLGALALSTLATVAPASALTAAQVRECRAMGASLQVRQTETEAKASERAALQARIEQAGDEWEAAEAMRLFGQAQAAEATASKERYDGLKQKLARREVALQSTVGMLNRDVYDYNQRCVRS